MYVVKMCTCIEDLYWTEIRLPLGPTVLLGVAALLVYRLTKFFTAELADADDESVITDDTAWDPYAENSGSEDSDAEDSGAEDSGPDVPVPDDSVADDSDPGDPDLVSALPPSASFWHSKVSNAAFDNVDPQDIFPEDDTEYVVSLIDAPVLAGPDVPVISSTEEASSEAALPSPGIAGTPFGSSPPDAA